MAKRQVSTMVILVMVLQILIPTLTVVLKSTITSYSNAEEISLKYANTKINSINELNTGKDTINSHEGDTESSSLSLNYREKIELTGEILDKDNKDLKYMAYPRLKKLSKEDKDGYKFLLTFQNCVIDENGNKIGSNGENIYYTRSKDLKTWDKPQKLYASENKKYVLNTNDGQVEKSKIYNYSSCDTYVLSDGRIMSVASKYAMSTGYYTMEQFKECGIYVRFSEDNGNSWSSAKRIYAGLCWEPSILQLKSGEIHVYFTHSAHVAYMNGYESKDGNGWIARLSAQSQSGSVAMLSSIDNGKTWSPNVEGTEENYNSNVRNPYSAYRIVQQTVKRLNGGDEAVNYNKLYYWSDAAKKWQKHLGIKKDESTTIKMTDQMPVAIELNNKNKIVMAMESKFITNGEEVEDINIKDDDYIKSHTTKSIHKISLASSEKKNAIVNGQEIGKYWIDLNDDQSSKEYKTEEEVYAGEGLGLTQEGPKNKQSNIYTGAAPYIAQFPSGETVLSYLENDSGDEFYGNTVLRLGNIEGQFKNNISNSLEGGIWNSVSLISSHCMAVTVANTSKENKTTTIIINPMYLNHTITASYLSNAESDSENIWNNNTDALFIGSKSQAQMTMRVAYDSNNVYFLVDRLDNSPTDEETSELYINTNKENDMYYKVVLDKNGAQQFKLVKSNSEENIGTDKIKSKVYVNNTNNENKGYKYFISIPRSSLEGSEDYINVNAILNNKDEESEEVVSDTFSNVSIEDKSTWNKVEFVKYMLGDVNEDMKVNIIDLLMLKKYILLGNGKELTDKIFKLADMNEDKKINIIDLLMIKRVILENKSTKKILI